MIEMPQIMTAFATHYHKTTWFVLIGMELEIMVLVCQLVKLMHIFTKLTLQKLVVT